MAVSNSVNFALTGNDLVIEARRKIGIHSDEEPLAAVDLESGLRAMTMMLKSWQAEGVMAWTLTEGTLTLVASDPDYVFGAGGTFTTVPLEITQMRITRNSSDIEMFPLTRQDYYRIPNKTGTGYPTQYYYDRQRSGGTLYVWPAPDATAGTLKFTYRRLIMDMDAGVDDIDLPQEWHDAIVYGLAKRLGENYGLTGSPEFKEIKAEAVRTYAAVKDFDTGEGHSTLWVGPADD